MPQGLKDPVRVSLDRLYLDPNNPRLASEHRPGYDDLELLFREELQAGLEQKVRSRYRINSLVSSILGMGWVPVDGMIVWEPAAAPGRYVVVEGNSRTVALRAIRRGYDREKVRLARARSSELRDPSDLRDRETLVARYERVVETTREVEVLPLAAGGPAEVAEQLPRLLGVRHITHAQQWKPYAANLYLCSLYERQFREAFGPEPLALDEETIAKVTELLTLSRWKVRRQIQTAVAFKRFKARFGDRLPEGESFADEDQAYFARLLEPGYARRRFGIGDADLGLSPEMEAVLFRWAFAKPRRAADQNRNILRSGDDIGLWNRMARYDEQHNSAFSLELDPERPERARPMAEVELEFLAHRGQQSPLDAVQSLLSTLKRLPVETVRAQGAELRPAIDELLRLGQDYRAILEAID
jgi:hypothetical protein